MIKFYFLIFVLLLSSCGLSNNTRHSAKQSLRKRLAKARSGTLAQDEKTFWDDYDAILKASAEAAYLKNSGQVFYISYINYKKLSSKKSFHKIIKSQLSKLAKTQIPTQTQSQIAFWINTYNFLVISEIVNNYPIKTNKAIRFKSKKHLIAGNHYSLDEIYKILLGYKDPRILLTVNSGRVAGPSIKLKSFSSAGLITELERQVKNDLMNPTIASLEKNIFNEAQLNLSDLFEAFDDKDFTSIKLEDFLKANLPNHLKDFRKIKISKSVYTGINSKRETMKLIRILESM